jgi:hypothetical protein
VYSWVISPPATAFTASAVNVSSKVTTSGTASSSPTLRLRAASGASLLTGVGFAGGKPAGFAQSALILRQPHRGAGERDHQGHDQQDEQRKPTFLFLKHLISYLLLSAGLSNFLRSNNFHWLPATIGDS